MARRDRRRRSNVATPSPVQSTPAAVAPVAEMKPQSRWFVGAAILAGVLLWVWAGNDLSAARWVVVLLAVGVAMVPPVTRGLTFVLDRLRSPSQRAQEWTGLVVGVVAAGYLTATAFAQERPLAPRLIDECSYAVSAQLLARGRLWMPQHPLADFFESYFLFVKPVYSSVYFPGTALAFAPGVWFNWGTWIIPVVLAGLSVGLLYRVVTTLSGDGVAGLLAAAWMPGLMAFRAVSVMAMSHVVMLALGLLIVWAWLRWRDAPRWGWTLAVGALCGWAAITRPVDALAYAVPVGVAMLLALRGKPLRAWAATAGLLVLGAAPFLALQVVHNVGVTGDPLRTPYTAYLEREQPGAQFGVRPYDPAIRPASALPQVNAYYDGFCRPFLQRHQPHNFLAPWFASRTTQAGTVQPPQLVTLATTAVPGSPLLLLLPAGVLALAAADRRRRVLAATLPLFVGLYVLNPFFLPHYAVVITPAVVLLALLGIDVVARAAAVRWAGAVRAAAVVLVLATSLTSLWEAKWLLAGGDRPAPDGFQVSPQHAFVEAALDATVKRPAVVLFGPPPDVWTEMVFTTDAAWPDDAAIVRARDLGPRNAEIIDYYGQRQPTRTFYQFDWQRGSLRVLGEAGALREQLRRAPPAGTPAAGNPADRLPAEPPRPARPPTVGP